MKFAAHFLGLLALASPASQIYSLAWSPDGATIALGGYKETRLVDARTQKTIATLSGSAEAVRAVAFSRDGKLLAAASGLPARKGEVKIWNVAARKPSKPPSPATPIASTQSPFRPTARCSRPPVTTS
jgi:WD40 repeat protein